MAGSTIVLAWCKRWQRKNSWVFDSGDSDELDGNIPLVRIASTNLAFAAQRADGSVVTWSHGGLGGESSSVSAGLDRVGRNN
jgi:hypothetical protein